MAAQLQDPEAIHQPSPLQQEQQQPQQFALQTLPQRVYAAATAGYVLDTTSADNSSDSSDNELDSNQFDVAEDSLGASLTRRKAQAPSAATPWQQQRSPLRMLRVSTESASAASALRASTSDSGNQQIDSYEPSGEQQSQRSHDDDNNSSSYATAMATASLRLERLEAMAHDLQTAASHKHNARTPIVFATFLGSAWKTRASDRARD